MRLPRCVGGRSAPSALRMPRMQRLVLALLGACLRTSGALRAQHRLPPLQSYGGAAAPRRHAPALAAAPVAAVALPQWLTLGAGMLGGAVGVGVAYPLDTIKVKVQSYTGDGKGGPIEVAREIVNDEGWSGFYSGVSSTMAGQALIKGVVFFVYEAVKSYLDGFGLGALGLITAACASGAAGSLVVTPIERVKVVMQAADAETFSSPLACMLQLLEKDGASGALFRGLGVTLAREIPAYGMYFVSYETTYALLVGLGLYAWVVPLLAGAAAGAIAWLPVYPIDVIKTNVQMDLDGGDKEGMLKVARRLWDEGGFAIFWDGIGPKLARAVVNHAVTFFVYEQTVALVRAWLL